MLEDILQDVVARKPLTWIDIAETVVGEMFGCERLRLDGIRRAIRRASDWDTGAKEKRPAEPYVQRSACKGGSRPPSEASPLHVIQEND